MRPNMQRRRNIDNWVGRYHRNNRPIIIEIIEIIDYFYGRYS
jgi:hypothetical protein